MPTNIKDQSRAKDLSKEKGSPDPLPSNPSLVESLKKQILESKMKEEIIDSEIGKTSLFNLECGFCEDEFNLNEKIVEIKDCKHRFHIECEYSMNKKKCTICQKPFDSNGLIPRNMQDIKKND